MNELKPNGWNDWAKYVLKAIEKQDKQISTLTDEIVELKLQLMEFKTKTNTRTAMIATIVSIVVPFILFVVKLTFEYRG